MPLAQIAPPHPSPLPIYPASVAFAPFHNLYPPNSVDVSLFRPTLRFVTIPRRFSSTFSLPCFYPLPLPPPPSSFYPVCVSPFLFAPPSPRRPRTFRDMTVLGYLRVTFETNFDCLVNRIRGEFGEFGERRRFREILTLHVHVVLYTFYNRDRLLISDSVSRLISVGPSLVFESVNTE